MDKANKFESRNPKSDATALVFGKVPPQAPELEVAILGAIMLERDAIESAMAILVSENMFYEESHRKIYRAAVTVYQSGGMVDLLTITEQLKKSNELEACGGAYYLTSITMGVVNGAHIERHCKIVYEMYAKRETIRICGEAISEAYEDSTDAFDVAAIASTKLSVLGDVAMDDFPVALHKIAVDEVISLEEKKMSGINSDGVPTGFETLDRLTGGWQDTDLIILAARPAVGKTAFVMNLAMNAGVSIKGVFNVAFFSLEMSKGQIGKRALSSKSGVDFEKIYRNALGLSDDEILSLRNTANDFQKCRMFINDRPGITPMYLKRTCKSLKKKHGLHMVVIDYLQLMNPTVKGGSRERDISSISSDLKSIAKDLEVPIIALSQLNREGEGGKPTMRHLRESGAIEQDADMVMFLYAPDADDPQKIVLSVAKHRNGSTDDIPFIFDKPRQRFYDMLASNNEQPDNPYSLYRRPNNDNAPF